MRVVIVGASGNIGTSTLEALAGQDCDIVAVARRMPAAEVRERGAGQVEWRAADISCDDLAPIVDGAEVVVNLAWLFHPSHRADETWRTNVGGASRLLDAVKAAGVHAVVHASSIAAYSPRTSLEPVDESWETHGTSSAAYCREKAYIERLLDEFELRHPQRRVVRIRPAFVFQRRAASQQRRLFAGPLVPGSLVRPGFLPAVPMPRGLALQAVHSEDVGAALARIITTEIRGAFNLCADDVLSPAALGRLVGATPVEVPPRVVRAALRAAWSAHLVPAAPELFDALMRVPVMDNQRAKSELGWAPMHTAAQAVGEFLEGLRSGAGHPTPPLDAGAGGPLRSGELATGVGGAADA
jgi:nucleoside-diphosphate-sugar epimerase